ncbi:alpha-mannosidase 2C1-like [Diadema antillarum]|uniref:alpha-mannosidase 2C1-like n=1 Tax=Diadema antillarum TaxID=105358 RepID=UPI003A8BE517
MVRQVINVGPSVAPVVFKDKRCTLERAEKFISSHYFTDCNLYGKLYPAKHPIHITHRKVNNRVTYQEATGEWSSAPTNSQNSPVDVVSVGSSYGPTWATHWFRLQIEIPDDWRDKEVHLLWNSSSEAMVWSESGEPLQGLNKDDRTSFILTRKHTPDSPGFGTLYIEMACNSMFGAGNGLIGPPALDRTFTLSQAEIAVFNREAYELMMDVETLIDIVKNIPEDDQRSFQALYTVNKMVNACDTDKLETYVAAREICQKFLAQRNGDGVHNIHACGNAHIDSAWLWPYAETKRKVARTWANVLRLMEDYEDFTFIFSQAQQFEWVKTNYPSLYSRVKDMVKRGRFIPVGGCWVEMDGNLPSGESFVRQLLYGQRFYKEEFGSYCKEFWLPDTFGYSAQLPQIMACAGIKRFVTQKLSWSLVNKFPHHTFWWQGIDGTKCLAHFPPTDTYGANVKVEEVLKNSRNNKDKGRVNHSLMLYGHGDGGGGPTKDMLERMKRLRDTNGIPRIKPSTPDSFFEAIEAESDQLCMWQGELYLELHQGTFTTQAEIKKLNRQLENKFRLVEFLLTLFQGSEVPRQSHISAKWRRLLLHQFHDVLPGSCIREVVEDATTDMKALMAELESDTKTILTAMAKAFSLTGHVSGSSKVICNTCSWDRLEVISLSCDLQEYGSSPGQDCKNLAMVTIPAMSMKSVQSCQVEEQPCAGAKVESTADGYRLSNEHMVASIDHFGRIIQIRLTKEDTPDVILPGGHLGNQFVVYDDIPLFWDAWDVMDYHLETRKPITHCIASDLESNNPLQVSLRVWLKISGYSCIEQQIVLRAASKYLEFHTKVHWKESHKFLKVEFPVNVRSPVATYEIQYGHLQRPTHQNTSWDWARYEVVGHKWMDLSQHNWGVAILNNCKYGHSVHGSTMRLSLLRSPKSPDDQADMGDHSFSYAIMPHTGTFQEAGVIQAAYEFNNPLTPVEVPTPLDRGHPKYTRAFSIHPSSVIIEAVKKAEDGSGAVIVRCYEAYGGEATAQLSVARPVSSFRRCDILEEECEPQDLVTINDSTVQFRLCPFQIVSIRITPQAN